MLLRSVFPARGHLNRVRAGAARLRRGGRIHRALAEVTADARTPSCQRDGTRERDCQTIRTVVGDSACVISTSTREEMLPGVDDYQRGPTSATTTSIYRRAVQVIDGDANYAGLPVHTRELGQDRPC